MSRRDDQSTRADHVSDSTEHLDLILGVVGDLTMVLQVAGEAEQNHALDLGLDVVGEGLYGVVDDGGALTVFFWLLVSVIQRCFILLSRI